MKDLQLKAEIRTKTGKKVKNLRKEGFIPAIVYGHKIKNIPLKIKYRDFKKIYEKTGESTLIELQIIPRQKGGEAEISKSEVKKVLIHNVQFDPLTDKFFHVDFYQVKMTEKITAEVALKFVGDAPAVKNKGGILVKNTDKLQVECLPQDLIHDIKVDIGKINELDDSIYVRDLPIPKGINILAGPDEPIATVVSPSVQEEEKEEEIKPEEVEKVKPAEEVSGEEKKKE